MRLLRCERIYEFKSFKTFVVPWIAKSSSNYLIHAMGRTDLAIVIGIQRWLRLILGWINSNKFYLLLWPGSGKKAIVGKESGRGWKQIDRNSKGVELGVDSRGLKWHKLRTGESGCLLCFLVGEIGKGYELRDTPIKLWTNPRFSVSEKAFPYCCIFLICLIKSVSPKISCR